MRFYSLLLSVFISGSLVSCSSNYTPKPRAYARIEFPEKKYQVLQLGYPYQFDFPVYAKVKAGEKNSMNSYWINLDYEPFNARLYLSYYPIKDREQLNKLMEDAHTFAFKHTVKATAINEALIMYPERKLYGIYYTIEGNTASSVQFYLTDSTKNYLRGALYFNETPKIDSIRPVLDFIKKDLDVMIKSFRWKN